MDLFCDNISQRKQNAMSAKQICPIVLLTFIYCVFLVSCEKEKHNDESPPKVYLNVYVGPGVEGNMKTGVIECDTGAGINWGFRAAEGYIDLLVTLDNKKVAVDSSFRIYKNHTLRAVAEQKMLWKFTTNLPPYFSCAAIGEDRTVYVTTGIGSIHQGMLYALKPDGTLKWSYTHTTALFSPVIGNDGNIYVQDFYNHLLSFSAAGDIRWTYNQFQYNQFDNVGQRCPAIGSDGTIYIGGCGLHALDSSTGTRKWIFMEGGRVKAPPAIGTDGTIYIVFGQDLLVAVNPDGSEKWRNSFTYPWEMSFTAPAIDEEGIIYLAAEARYENQDISNIYAFNPEGTLKWKYPVKGERFVRASPVIDVLGNIIIATKATETTGLTAKVFALSESGTVVWEFDIENVHETGDDIYSTPSIDENGLIYFGAETGYLYALNPNGTLNYKYALPCAVNWSSPAIDSEGVLYIGGISSGLNEPGIFSAIKISGKAYASTPWPRFMHDSRNSGRYGAK